MSAEANQLQLTASCNCGKIKLSLTGLPKHAYICYCYACRKDTGSLFTTQIKYDHSGITWISGKSLLKRWYGIPVQGDEDDPVGATVRKDEKGEIRASNGWCSICGTQLIAEMEDGVIVRFGAIDVEDDPRAAEILRGALVGGVGEGGEGDEVKKAFIPKHEYWVHRKVDWAKGWGVEGAKQFGK